MNRKLPVLLIAVALAACQSLSLPRAPQRAAPASDSVMQAPALLEGTFDNHEQVWTAREKRGAGIAPPHVVITLAPTAQQEWSVWRIHLDAATPIDALWAMHATGAAVAPGAAAASGAVVPYRALVAAPGVGAAFDPKQWTSLDGCALHGNVSTALISVRADLAACTALAPGIGAEAALLPLAVEREGEWLRVRLYADQARGADAREEARKVEFYGGWAAINGSGPQARAESNDWHMNRSLRLGSEGGGAILTWRDGKPSGYSLDLERLTYREGNVPVLKLSVIDDATGRTLAYAWANPQATRIGLSLGWLQVGLDRNAPMTTAKGNAK